MIRLSLSSVPRDGDKREEKGIARGGVRAAASCEQQNTTMVSGLIPEGLR